MTGTLQTLGSFETRVKNEEYQITKSTITPSIYGDSQLRFREKDDVFVEPDSAQYFRKVKEGIIEKVNNKQAVIVFFEDEQKLNGFVSSGYCKGLEYSAVTEETKNIDFFIKKATITGKVTFFPRVYGRGLDFACRDDTVDKAGGIHVIQTFLSEDYSEEVQIKGRTARQGKHGSFSLILCVDDLTRQFGLKPEEIKEQQKGSNIYAFLHEKRVSQFERKSADRKGIIERSLQVRKIITCQYQNELH